MTSDVTSELITGLLPLVGAGFGTSATNAVQRGSTKAARLKYATESRSAQRDEIKAAVVGYLEHAQRLQGQLDARERGQVAY